MIKSVVKLNISLLLLLLAHNSFGQAPGDSLYTDFDLQHLKPANPAIVKTLIPGNKYISIIHPGNRRKERLKLLKVRTDSSLYSRKARLFPTSYGPVLAFKVIKDGGYEKILIFAAYDYYYDSLLIRNDTLIYKNVTTDDVSLYTVYPVKNDTLIIEHGYRLTRYDFLDKFKFIKPLSNYQYWYPDNNFDYIEILTFVKKDNQFELTGISNSKGPVNNSRFESLKENYKKALLSLFWIALANLHF